jgi:hypothetical protein
MNRYVSRKSVKYFIPPVIAGLFLFVLWWLKFHENVDPRAWAEVISAGQLMELVEKGLHPGPRIIHQSWTTQDLPLHVEKKTLAWRKYHSYDWV